MMPTDAVSFEQGSDLGLDLSIPLYQAGDLPGPALANRLPLLDQMILPPVQEKIGDPDDQNHQDQGNQSR
jgi:hypothetical protein